jgi:hypothetical protein
MSTIERIKEEIEKWTQGGKVYNSFQAVATLYVALAIAELAEAQKDIAVQSTYRR